MSLQAYYRSLRTGTNIGGGALPSTGAKRVIFRSLSSPSMQLPPVTPKVPVPGPGGRYRDVANFSNWQTAMAAAIPGDVIRITNTITSPLQARGGKYNLWGSNMHTSPLGGADGNPIIITCADPSIYINPNNMANGQVALDMKNNDHVWAVGVNVKRSTFGIRCLNWEGSAANPARISHCKSEELGHNAYQVQGWWQTIAGSGGTPPPGAGNESGFSKHFIVEYNHARDTGNTLTHGGEAFYFGKGDGPAGFVGWYGWASDGLVRGNVGEDFTSDGYDVKPGCRNIKLLHNVARRGVSDAGAFMNCLYVAGMIDDKPAWVNFDPEIYVEQNILYDLNLSRTTLPTSDQLAYIGQSGVRYSNNIHFAYPNGLTPFNAGLKLRMEKPEAQFGTYDTIVRNNLFWGRGVENVGYGPSGTPTALTLGAWYTQENNIVPVGYGGGEQFAATNGSDFEGIIEAIGDNGTAEWNTDGHGSGFDLKLASALRGTGTAFTVADLELEEDISQRTVPVVTPNPGPYQDF